MNAAPHIIPIILSGGAGTRLWPVSRQNLPKQFQKFGTEATLLQQTLVRCGVSIFDSRPILVGEREHRGLLLNTLQSMQVSGDIILEPCRRESCAAVLVGAIRALERDENAIVLVLAADHHIPDHAAFHTAISLSLVAAQNGYIVAFGVSPRSAATGYGYILPDVPIPNEAVSRVRRFVEKPDRSAAARYIGEGYLWNSGNLLFHAATFVEEVRALSPLVYDAVVQSLQEAQRDTDFIRLSETAFARSPSVSVDVAIMEKTTRASVMPVDYVWNDIGTWDAIAATMSSDHNNNSHAGYATIVGGQNVMVQSETKFTAVVGCNDIIVVTTDDAVLVVRRGASEDVRALKELLELNGFKKLL